LCNRPPEGFGLDVVREATAPVDLHNWQPLPIFGLESRVAADVHLTQLEPELVPKGAHLCERALAQVTAFRVVDDDLGYG
jgi:hypothetical protein